MAETSQHAPASLIVLNQQLKAFVPTDLSGRQFSKITPTAISANAFWVLHRAKICLFQPIETAQLKRHALIANYNYGR